MKHFHRTHLNPDAVMLAADSFFPSIGLSRTASAARTRTFEGVVGTPDEVVTLKLMVKMEGGHHTFVEAHSTASGESAPASRNSTSKAENKCSCAAPNIRPLASINSDIPVLHGVIRTPMVGKAGAALQGASPAGVR